MTHRIRLDEIGENKQPHVLRELVQRLGGVRDKWQDKQTYLELERVKTSHAETKYELEKGIEEAKTKIAVYDAQIDALQRAIDIDDAMKKGLEGQSVETAKLIQERENLENEQQHKEAMYKLQTERLKIVLEQLQPMRDLGIDVSIELIDNLLESDAE